MTVLHRAALEASPLADLHAIASELGHRRLPPPAQGRAHRRASCADAAASERRRRPAATSGDEAHGRRRRARPSPGAAPRRRRRAAAEERRDAARARGARARPSTRGGARRRRDAAAARPTAATSAATRRGATAPSAADESASRASSSCSATARASCASSPPEPSDDDVYISAAQVRRCELVSGDRVTGPGARAAPLGALPVARARRHDQRPPGRRGRRGHAATTSCRAPARRERLALGSDDPTLKAIEWLTPIGRGSRVVIVGASRCGQDRGAAPPGRRAGRRARASSVSLVLTGVRPRRLAEWKAGRAGSRPPRSRSPRAADAQAQALERAVETAQRVAARGGHAVRAHRHARRHRPRRRAPRRWPPRAASSTAAR